MRHETEHKGFAEPDETREFPNGKAEILSIGGSEVGRMTLEPGWRCRAATTRGSTATSRSSWSTGTESNYAKGG